MQDSIQPGFLRHPQVKVAMRLNVILSWPQPYIMTQLHIVGQDETLLYGYICESKRWLVIFAYREIRDAVF